MVLEHLRGIEVITKIVKFLFVEWYNCLLSSFRATGMSY